MAETGHLLPFPQAPDGIELRHLRAFVAVAEELSFTRAAERLYVSAPALSRQISGLEGLLGCELLRRSRHRVELTLPGEALLDRARKLLHDVDEAVAATMMLSGELLGRAASLWRPLEGLLASEASLQEARAATEELHAQVAPPPGTNVRAVNAGGVPSLVVSPSTSSATSVLHLQAARSWLVRRSGTARTRGRWQPRHRPGCSSPTTGAHLSTPFQPASRIPSALKRGCSSKTSAANRSRSPATPREPDLSSRCC
jgi:DNA-binding MarR family transcriptional regulator